MLYIWRWSGNTATSCPPTISSDEDAAGPIADTLSCDRHAAATIIEGRMAGLIER